MHRWMYIYGLREYLCFHCGISVPDKWLHGIKTTLENKYEKMDIYAEFKEELKMLGLD